MLPTLRIAFGQVGPTEAFEDMQRLAPVLRVVKHDVDDHAAERLARGRLGEGVDEGVIPALLVAQPAPEGREGCVGALMAFDQRGQ